MTEYLVNFVLAELSLAAHHLLHQGSSIAVLHEQVDVIGALHFYLLDVHQVHTVFQLLGNFQFLDGRVTEVIFCDFDDLDCVLAASSRVHCSFNDRVCAGPEGLILKNGKLLSPTVHHFCVVAGSVRIGHYYDYYYRKEANIVEINQYVKLIYLLLAVLSMNRRSGSEYDKDGNLLQKELLVKLMLNRSIEKLQPNPTTAPLSAPIIIKGFESKGEES